MPIGSLYPLTFRPILKDRVWGGRRLNELYRKQLPPAIPIGESWEISDRAGDISVVASGAFAGKDLHWVVENLGADLLNDAKLKDGRFPLLIKSQFPGVNPLEFAWMGPFVGALIRPVGGWLADRAGGARVTFWNFIAMALGVIGVLYFLPQGGVPGNLTGFFLCFMLLFLTAGIGNGSTFRMIPVIFTDECLEAAPGKSADERAAAVKEGNKQAAAVLGFTAALGAYGGFFIPKSYGTSIAMTGSPHAALWAFVIFYITCIAITWWFYARRGAQRPC